VSRWPGSRLLSDVPSKPRVPFVAQHSDVVDCRVPFVAQHSDVVDCRVPFVAQYSDVVDCRVPFVAQYSDVVDCRVQYFVVVDCRVPFVAQHSDVVDCQVRFAAQHPDLSPPFSVVSSANRILCSPFDSIYTEGHSGYRNSLGRTSHGGGDMKYTPGRCAYIVASWISDFCASLIENIS
jgi:hypothetical protein